MKKHMRRLMTLLSLMLIMTITGCNQTDKEIDKAQEEQIELTFFYPVQVGGALTNFIEELADEFTSQHPNIKINPVYTGNYEATVAQIKKAQESGNCPDFFVSLAADRFSMVEMNVIEPLDQLIARDKDKSYIEGFLPEFMQDSYVDNKVWSIPFQRSVQILYYNKDAFREAGLDSDKPPTTWDELIEYSKKLVKKDARGNVQRWGVGMALNKGALPWSFGAFSLQNSKDSGNLMSDDGKAVYFDTPENVEVLELWKSLQKEYKVMPKGVMEWADLPNDFLDGKYAMIYNTTGNLTNIFKKADFEFGTAMLPGSRQIGGPIGGGNFYICKDTSQGKKEAAWEFIKFATKTPEVVEWSVNTGYIPTRKDAFKTELINKYYEEIPQARVSQEQLPIAKPELATYEQEQIWEILNNNIKLAMNDILTSEEALKKAQQEADKLLSKYN